MHDRRPLVHVLKRAAHAGSYEDGELNGWQARERQVLVEKVGKTPAIDVLEHDAQIAIDPLEVENPPDVLVIQDCVSLGFFHEESDERRVLFVDELLDDDRALETRFTDEACTKDTTHPAGAEFFLESVACGHAASNAHSTDSRALYCAAMRVMALDVGDRTIGVALSDERGILASPVTTMARKNLRVDAAAIATLAKKRDASLIVAGLPLQLDGEIGPQAEKVQQFVGKLRKRATIPVEFLDERLTTTQAERVLIQADLSRRRRKEVIDQMAAVLILQAYLDAQQPRLGGRS